MLRAAVTRRLTLRSHSVSYSSSPLLKTSAIAPGVHLSTPSSCSDSTPLVILSGWVRAKPSQMKRYLDFYHERGFESIAFAVTPKEVLNPGLAEQHMTFILEQILERVCRASSRPVVYHGFSVSGYLFGLSLMAMKNQSTRFQPVKKSFRAQIFDSPPDFDCIAAGIGKMLETNDFREDILRKLVELYLKATYDTAGVKHRAASKAFWENDLQAPALWFYSKVDEVAPWTVCRDCAAAWRKRGIEVDEVVFDDSKHIQHMRKYPERYLGALGAFLDRYNIGTNA